MASPPPADRSVAQWITGPRLLKLGEEITFDFFVPPGAEVGRLEVFTQYLGRGAELAQTSDEPPLAWLDSLPRETHELRFNNGHATFSYRPTSTGNYITRWTALLGTTATRTARSTKATAGRKSSSSSNAGNS